MPNIHMNGLLSSIVKLSIYAAVFCVPLAFAPWTFEAFEFNKQYALFLLVSVGAAAWFAHMIMVRKEIRLLASPFDLLVLGFFAVSFFSALVSQDRWSSLVGYYGRFGDGVLQITSFVLLYVLLRHHVAKEQVPGMVASERLQRVFLAAGAAMVAVTYASLFGLLAKLSFLPSIMKFTVFTPGSATLEGLSVFLAGFSVYIVARLFFAVFSAKAILLHLVLLAASFGIVFRADFAASWIVLIAGLLLLLVSVLWQQIQLKGAIALSKLWLPFLLLVASAFIFFSPAADQKQDSLLQEPLLPHGTSWSIALDTVQQNVKNAVVGSGPGTFAIDFAQHKPEAFNETKQWQLRFDRAGNHMAEVLATQGIAGFVLWIALAALFLLFSLFRRSYMAAAVFALAVGQLFYYQTTLLLFSFWFFLALGMVLLELPAKEFAISLRKFPEVSVVFRALLVFAVILLAFLYFLGAKVYMADTKYLQAHAQRGNNERQIALMQEAITYNPRQADYAMHLSRLYLERALMALKLSQKQQDQAAISLDITMAIAYGRGDTQNGVRLLGATEIAPRRVAAWEALGVVYRDIQFAPGALDWGIRAFEEAVRLEPMNPVLLTELGKLLAAQKQYAKAREYFGKAVATKPDYPAASKELALLKEKEGNIQEALLSLEELARRYSTDAGLLFELGRLYYNRNELAKAQVQFQLVLELEPNHSNAHFAQAALYEKQGKRKEALAAYQRVLALNPENENVVQKIQELQQ